MTRLKKVSLGAVVVFALIQFAQPARNEGGQVLDTDISKTVSVPGDVQAVLKKSCFDCHSNHTEYPWHGCVQPAGWFMAYHIRNGKEKLNFSEFGAYPKRRQASKMKSIASQIEGNVMPLASYTWLHRNAILAPAEKDLIIQWATSARDSLSQ